MSEAGGRRSTPKLKAHPTPSLDIDPQCTEGLAARASCSWRRRPCPTAHRHHATRPRAWSGTPRRRFRWCTVVERRFRTDEGSDGREAGGADGAGLQHVTLTAEAGSAKQLLAARVLAHLNIPKPSGARWQLGHVVGSLLSNASFFVRVGAAGGKRAWLKALPDEVMVWETIC